MLATIYLDTNSLIKCALACTVVILLAGCRSSPSPQPSQSQPEPLPTARDATSTTKPTSESASSRPEDRIQTAEGPWDQHSGQNADVEVEAEAIHFDPVEDLIVRLPDGWKAAKLGLMEIQTHLSAFVDNGTPAAAFLSATGSETGLLAAVYAGPLNQSRPQPTLTMAAIPRHGLKLKQYVDEISAALADEPGIHVERTGLLYDVRDDGMPVGIVMYRQSPADERPELKGYHLVQLDGDGTNLVVMNWIASPDVLESLLPAIHTAAASVESQYVTP